MKIGIDARLWNETGVGRYIRNLVSNLVKLDTQNEYVLFVQKGIKNEQLRINNEKWRTVEVDVRWHSIKEQVQFANILNKEELDLVHFPYFSVPVLYRKPFVVTIHDLIINHFPTGKASTLPLPLYYFKLLGYKFVVRNTIQNAKKIISVSNATKDEILNHYKVSSDKIAVTYEGVEEVISSQALASSSNKKTDGSMLEASGYFLYVGNAYPHKNLMKLLDAIAELRIKNSELRVILVGKEDYFYKQIKEKVQKLNLEQNVEFKGYVSDTELAKLYQNAKATIIPSVMEGFSLPGLEAMSRNCLVIASDIPVHKEIFGNACLYFDPKSSAGLTDVLEAVLTNPDSEYHEILKVAKKRVLDFSWKKTAEETLSVYNSLS